MKIGDGVTAYGNLKYFGGEAALNFEVIPTGEETDIQAITAAIGDTEIHNGDTAIVKRAITGDKKSYTAYKKFLLKFLVCQLLIIILMMFIQIMKIRKSLSIFIILLFRLLLLMLENTFQNQIIQLKIIMKL